MKQIFINLPVDDLEKSKNFYTEIGFTVNPLFTFYDQICMVWSEHIYVMLQTKYFFYSGNKTQVLNLNNNSSSTFTLPVGGTKEVNEIVERGLKAGGTEPNKPIDEGYMQIRTIVDLDGHTWGIIYLDLDKFSQQKKSFKQ